VPGPPADHLHGVIVSAQDPLVGRIARDADDAKGQGDLLSLRSLQQSFPVPALGQKGEQLVHRRGQTQPLRQHFRDVADGCHVGLHESPYWDQSPRDLVAAAEWGSVRRREGADEAGKGLQWRSHHPGSEVFGPAPREDALRDIQVGRTPRVHQEGGVVGLGLGLAIDIEQIGEPHGHERAVKTVLEREPHAQVGRQARGGDDLGCSDGLGLRRCLLNHASKGYASAAPHARGRTLTRAAQPTARRSPRRFRRDSATGRKTTCP
jgi:hypothetical protein